MKPLKLANFEVSENSMPYVIAEIGVNHENSIESAIALVDAAKRGGAHAAKFQTYKAHMLAMRESPAYWDQSKETASSQRELFARYDSFGVHEYRRLAEHCAEVGIDFMSTPFDLDAVDMLEPLVDVFKIASADITNVPLLRRVARTGKPIVLSTGASEVVEIDAALSILESGGADQVVLLHCILNYPTRPQDANLGMISHLRARYPNHWVGSSDHTEPTPDMLALTTAFVLGAKVIEKHFTLDKTLPGNDHYHAMDERDLRKLTSLLERIQSLMGSSEGKFCLPSEEPARRFARRGVCAATDLPAGHVLTERDLLCKRPATEVSASQWDEIIGRTLRVSLNQDDALTWDHLR